MESFFEEQLSQISMLEVFKARPVVYNYLSRTHLNDYSTLSDDIGADVFIKHENHLPTNSFKVRGAVNFIFRVDPKAVENGIVVATRGNHGLAVAWACKKRGILCNVVVPENNDPMVNEMIHSYGAQLIEHGSDFYEAQDYCEELAENAGYYYLRQGNEPLLLTGIATMGLEIFEDLPDVDAIIMPIGGGTGCAALALVIRHINPSVELIGVQSHKMPSFYQSWKEGKKVTVPPADTIAAGLAARSVFDIPYYMLRDAITDVVLLSEDELKEGVKLAMRYTQNLAEVAGSASLAAAFKIRDRLIGKKIVLIMTGGNLNPDLASDILCE